MIRRNQRFLNMVNMVLDMLLVMAAYLFSAWFRLDVMGGSSANMAAVGSKSLLMAFVYSVVLFFILSLLGFYATTRTRRLIWKVRTLLIAVTVSILFASTLLYLFRLEDFSRGVLLLFYGTTLVLLIGKYVLMRLVFNQLRKRGYNLKHVLVVGNGKLAHQFAQDVEKERSLGIRVEGFIGKADFDRLDQMLASPHINEAVIALEPEEYGRIRELISACEKNGTRYYIIPFYNDVMPAHPIIESIGRSKLINMRANRLENTGWRLLKRGLDLIVSLMGLIVLSPLMLLIAIGVKLSSPGPVFFSQTRVGFERNEFQMLKFRSMRINAESETAWSRDTDPRRTRFGSFLRKTSLDELPQLWNVACGDMSLVGPRPELPYYVERFRETIPFYMVKHQVKPGMTGWAQIHGYRGDTSIEKRIELDLWYIEHWSIWLDLKILCRTVFGGMINKEKA